MLLCDFYFVPAYYSRLEAAWIFVFQIIGLKMRMNERSHGILV